MDINRSRTEYDAQRYMLIMIVALTPCFMMGVYVFGLDMLDKMLGGCGLAVLISVAAGKISDMREAAAHGRPAGGADKADPSAVGPAGRIRKDREPEYLAAMVTGALIVFTLPSTIPIRIVLIGVAIAMIPAGYLMDRLLAPGALKKAGAGREGADAAGGAYLLERAIVTSCAANAALLALFRTEMNTWPLNDFVETRVTPGDVATGMTPLGILADGGDLPGLSRMFIGFISGPCGEVSVAAAVIGGGYLIWKKIISPVIPACVIASVFASSFAYYAARVPAEEINDMIEREVSGLSAALYMAGFQVLAGGAVFGAFFLAPALYLRIRDLSSIKASFAGGIQSAADDPYKRNKGEQESRKEKKIREDAGDLPLQIVCGISIGLLTTAIRIYGIRAEGAALPVLIMYVVYCVPALILLRAGKRG